MLTTGAVLASSVSRGGSISGCYDAMCAECICEAGECHLGVGIDRIEEGLKLRLVRMIAHITGIEHLHGKLGPDMFVQSTEFL